MQQWLLQLWADFDKTVVFVTHDVEEAVYLSDQVIVMTRRPGRIEDVVDVPVDRPRAPDTLHRPDFIALKQRCLELLRNGNAGTAAEENTE
jgi:ABC-type nitrate/sulfonate/bicarbonate transport system ATPase subunit